MIMTYIQQGAFADAEQAYAQPAYRFSPLFDAASDDKLA